jgi:hypothetical protein
MKLIKLLGTVIAIVTISVVTGILWPITLLPNNRV